MHTQSMNRETWIERMTYEKVIPHFTECGFPLLEMMNDFEEQQFKFSVSFMEGTRQGSKMKVIGRHYPASFTKSENGIGTQQILIHPSLDDPVKVVGVLIHELIHAQLPMDAGHGKDFRAIALKVGLCGKMTATEETPELQEKIKGWVKEIGDYPHSSFDHKNGGGRKKQTTRMIKVECLSDNEFCGNGTYKVRMSRKLIEEFGCPVCPNCGFQMDAESNKGGQWE